MYKSVQEYYKVYYPITASNYTFESLDSNVKSYIINAYNLEINQTKEKPTALRILNNKSVPKP